MRLLFGIVVGVALTVGVAFLADNWNADTATTTGSATSYSHRNMVNWDVVQENMSIVKQRAHDAWTRLSNKTAN